MASMFAHARVQREPHREASLLEAGGSEALSIDEEDNNGEEELTCFKELVAVEKGRMDGQQRDVSVLMADTPSPAPSVISIHSELTDGEDERDEKEPHLHV